MKLTRFLSATSRNHCFDFVGAQSYLIDFVKAQDFESAVLVLDQGRQTFDPIAIVAVQNAVDIANFSVVNMPAHHAIESVFSRL